jgi:hypothetical protein
MTRIEKAARQVLQDRHKRARTIAGLKRTKTLLKRRGWIKHTAETQKGYDLVRALRRSRVTPEGVALVKTQTKVKTLVAFNDHPHRRLRDVIDLLDRSVAVLEAGPRR